MAPRVDSRSPAACRPVRTGASASRKPYVLAHAASYGGASMELQRRLATPGDQPVARRIHHHAYREVVERQFGRWDESEQDAYFDDAWPLHEHDMLELDDSACGYFAVEFGAEAVNIHELVLHPAYQGRGIGTQLLIEVVDQAQGLMLPVMLQVLLENDRAARLYERLGFSEYSVTDTHRQMRLQF